MNINIKVPANDVGMPADVAMSTILKAFMNAITSKLYANSFSIQFIGTQAELYIPINRMAAFKTCGIDYSIPLDSNNASKTMKHYLSVMQKYANIPYSYKENYNNYAIVDFSCEFRDFVPLICNGRSGILYDCLVITVDISTFVERIPCVVANAIASNLSRIAMGMYLERLV